MDETVTSIDSSTEFGATREWLASPIGRALLAAEARLVEGVLDGMFGEECLQLGAWGEPRSFLRFARTQHTACIASPPYASAEEPPSAFGRMHRLPVASDSIDLVILPHTLDFSGRQPEILREVHRILRSDGHLVVLGFTRGGLWGLRRLIPGAAMPPGTSHLVGDGKLVDWLTLLDLRIKERTPYFFKLPLPGRHAATSPVWEERGRRWWPLFAACYLLAAQKRVQTMTPVRPVWSAKPKVVGGLVEPSTRVSRIRVDQDR